MKIPEIDSTSTDDQVISAVSLILTSAEESVDDGEGLRTRLESTESPEEGLPDSPEWISWRDAVAQATVEAIFERRKRENFFSGDARNDTEALRTPSALAEIWADVIRIRAAHYLSADITATYAGFLYAVDLGAARMVKGIGDKEGAAGLRTLVLQLDVLTARHESEGWYWIRDAVREHIAG